MLTQMQFRLIPDQACFLSPEWSYRLYAALLKQAPHEFGDQVHEGGMNPVSQYALCSDGGLLWTVSMLGKQAEEALCPVLQNLKTLCIQDEQMVTFSVYPGEITCINGFDDLLKSLPKAKADGKLSFLTPCAFRSQGEYVNIPSTKLILQNIVRKWNSCITECPIDDTDGEGLQAIIDGLSIKNYSLRSQGFHLKTGYIQGFTGEITLQSELTGFHRELLYALLLFSTFAGIGIKTTMGMGAVKQRFI